MILDFTPRHKWEEPFNIQTFRCIIVEHWMTPFLRFPLSPRSIPDTSNFAVSTTLVDFPRPSSTASFAVYFVHFPFSRTMLVKRKNRPRVYCRYLARKYALTLATIVRRMVHERSPTRSVRVNDKTQVSSKTESNHCRIYNCNKRIS